MLHLCKGLHPETFAGDGKGIRMEDKKIIQLLFARAENAITELSIRFGKQLYRIAHNILENHQDAEESTNDT